MTGNPGNHVLIVDDNAPNVMVAVAMLDMLECTYSVAVNGVQGLQKFLSGQYDLILMDVQIPVMSGLETTERIRAIERQNGLKRTPITMMSAHIDNSNMHIGVNAGMDDMIPKPFHPDYFSKMINKYCGVQKVA